VTINWNAPFVFLSSGLEVLNPFSQPSTNNPPHAAGTISGLSTVCQGTAYTFSITTVVGATTYNWSAPSNATISGQGTNSVSIRFGSSSGPVSVSPINSFGTGTGYSLLVNVNQLPSTNGIISGPTSGCANQSGLVYSVSTISGATNYSWTVPSGAQLLQGNGTSTVTINLGSTAGNLVVYPINACGTSSGISLPLSVINAPNASGTIAGVSVVCANQTGIGYSIATVSGATSYAWSASGATILNGNGSNSISVAFGTSNATINVRPINACGTGGGSNLGVQVQAYSVAGISISGTSTVVCSGSSLSFTSTVTNGGNQPTINWYRNSLFAGTGSGYTFIPANNDLVQAVVIPNASSLLCLTNSSATSSGVSITVNPILNPSVGITASQSTVCSGSTVTFTATGTNGGSSPTYQWFRNGISQGSGTTYSYVPSNGDNIQAVMSAGGT
ncbi:MAG: hypothetical protein K2Q22_17760, partial [Cytophagales bacterium]|nr:hypothetical protein [Cytophagales bacterium]